MTAEARLQAARFVAFDSHKHYVTVGAVDAQQNVVLPLTRVANEELSTWIGQNLQASDAVVLEASSNAWHLCDLMRSHVSSVTVAHPLLVKLIAKTRVKTDARDTYKLARLLAAGFIPPVWVPPQETRDLRALVAHRCRLVGERTRLRNRLRSILQSHNLVALEGDLFAANHRDWWASLELTVAERLLVQQDLALLDALSPLIAAVEAELLRQSTLEPWVGQVGFLIQLAGIGVLTAMVLLSAIGDVARFPSAKKLVGYSGLGTSVYSTGEVYRTGRITKEGRKEMRWVMVEAAWVAVERDAHWKREFERLSRRIGRKKAIVAVARKLLVVVWHVLTEHVADHRADSQAVARKVMTWAAEGRAARRMGLTRADFVRQHLDALGLGKDLEQFEYSGRAVRLPISQAEKPEGGTALG